MWFEILSYIINISCIINVSCVSHTSFPYPHQAMCDATIKDRLKSFQQAPGTSMFIHWLVGMVYVFYFASFILLLREVLRPGVLWFLRNLNDPDFNPIQEVRIFSPQNVRESCLTHFNKY